MTKILRYAKNWLPKWTLKSMNLVVCKLSWQHWLSSSTTKWKCLLTRKLPNNKRKNALITCSNWLTYMMNRYSTILFLDIFLTLKFLVDTLLSPLWAFSSAIAKVIHRWRWLAICNSTNNTSKRETSFCHCLTIGLSDRSFLSTSLMINLCRN